MLKRGSHHFFFRLPILDSPGVNKNENDPNETGVIGEILANDFSKLPDYLVDDTSPFLANDVTANRLLPEADSESEINSIYLGGNLTKDDWFIEGGARFERSRLQTRARPFPFSGVNPFDGFNDNIDLARLNPKPSESHDVLPSVAIGANFFDEEVTVLAAWSRTVARPTFQEFTNLRTFDPVTGAFPTGNPNLKNSRITNFDLSTTYSPSSNPEFQFRGSLFSKTLQDPIITVFRQTTSGEDVLTFLNGAKGVIRGVELEALWDFEGPFSLQGNYTYIDASLDYDLNPGTGTIQPVIGADFQFQPSNIINLNFGYTNQDLNLNANLVYNFTGEYVTIQKTSPAGEDVVRAGQHSLDFLLRKTIDIKDASLLVSAGVKNLLASSEEYYYGDQLYEKNQGNRAFWFEAKLEF